MSNFAKAFQGFNPALEGAATDVKAGRETEIVIYARITDFEGLKKASSKNAQEQWQVNGPFGKIRVRNEAQEGIDGKYSMTIKSKDSMLGGAETEMGIDQDVFEAFKIISDRGMVKDRYCFPVSNVLMRDQSGKHNIPIPDLVFEVDVFKKPDGTYHEWCKIDIEIDSILDAVKNTNDGITSANFNINVSDLPFRPTEMMENTTKDQAIRDKITELYDTVFLSRRTNEQAGVAAQFNNPPSPAPTQVVEDKPAPAPQEPAAEPATPPTDDLSGVDNPPAPEPSLETPDQAPSVDDIKDKKGEDAPVSDVPPAKEGGIPIADLEAAANRPAPDSQADDKPPAEPAPPKEESAVDEPTDTPEEIPVEDKPADAPADEPTPDAPATEPEAPPETPDEPTTEEEPVVDPDSVVEAGGAPEGETVPEGKTANQEMNEAKIREIMRDEFSAMLNRVNAK